jgi:hypothetical protein
VVLERFKQFKDFENRYDKSLQLLKNFKNLTELTKWSLLFHPFFENTFNSLGAIEEFLRDYKFPAQFIKSVLFNFEQLKWMQTFSAHREGEILEFVFSQEGKLFLNYYAELPHDSQDLQKIERILRLKGQWKELPKPLIDGNDLMDLGFVPGASFKKNLKTIYYHQLEKKITSKDDLLTWTKSQKF